MTKTFAVVTTIYPPSSQILQLSRVSEVELVVVGDMKTPKDWEVSGVSFLSVDEQLGLKFRSAHLLPMNHYSRKNIGYLHAIEHGADIIFDTDDDNQPLEWIVPDFSGDFAYVGDNRGFVNGYALFTDMTIWPRGHPIGLLRNPEAICRSDLEVRQVDVGIWQGLAQGEPDVDAIYRLTDGRECEFRDDGPVVFGPGCIAPFNSQATFFAKSTFPLLFLPAGVTFRFTDILRGLVAQPILWQHGLHMGFLGPFARQARNVHDLMEDFRSEIPMYLTTEQVIVEVKAVVSSASSIEDNMLAAYRRLHEIDIVPNSDLDLLEAWLEDLASLSI